REDLGDAEQLVVYWDMVSSRPVHPRDLRRTPEADHGLGAETILATVAGFAYHKRALEEFDAARAIEAARDKCGRGRTCPGGRSRQESPNRHEQDRGQRKSGFRTHAPPPIRPLLVPP